ncbi:hypothetical protein OG558_13545 [Kribbella sp. NBC_01510]|uniref:hypothetical protein n=1 Tax=Kribbella sp. NBC_01510 TaxID=2903581 RepID=UPI00386B49F8
MKAREKIEDKPVGLKILLNRALRSQSYRKIGKAQGSDYSVGSSTISKFLVSAIFLGSAISINRILDLTLWHSVVLVAGIFVAWIALVLIFGVPETLIVFLLMFLWLAAGGYLIISGELSTLVFTHLLPFGVILGVGWVGGSIRLAGHVPLFVPLALIIVLLPLLTEDPWKLASEAGARIAILAALSIVPLCYVLILRIARTDVGTTFAQGASRIGAEPSKFSARASRFLLKKMRQSGEVELRDDEVREEIEAAYSRMDSYLEQATSLAGRAFRVRAVRRLLTMVIGISLAVWLLIYILAWAAMPVSLAKQWSGQDVAFWTPSPLGFELSLPLGPYLLVAALLATVACVGFLGFALTEDQYSEALWGAVIHRTAEDCLMFAVPYLHQNDTAEIGDGEPVLRAAGQGSCVE